MDYILMPDDTVKVVESASGVRETLGSLNIHGGVALYWQALPYGWCKITPRSMLGNVLGVKDEDVPYVIKLAAMLE